jgi:hypothetical protein
MGLSNADFPGAPELSRPVVFLMTVTTVTLMKIQHPDA